MLLASAALPLAIAQSDNPAAGTDQSGTSRKYKRKRAKIHIDRGTTVAPKSAGAPGSSTAAPAPNPANPADPTLPTTTKPPAK